MAQSVAKKKTQRRQSTKRKLPSSSAKKKQSTNLKKIKLPLSSTKTLQLTLKISTKKKRKSTARRQSKALPAALIVTGLGGVLFAGWLMFYQTPLYALSPTPTPKDTTQSTDTNQPMPASDAVKLKITDIGVDATVVAVGKRDDGTVDVPSNPQLVGQYKYAPTPGENGPAIIVGHVDSIAGTQVFWRLRELMPGQTIEVIRADKTKAIFRVDSVKNFRQDNFPTKEVYGNIDYPGLRLITCGGTFNYLTQHYSENTVVFASLAN